MKYEKLLFFILGCACTAAITFTLTTTPVARQASDSHEAYGDLIVAFKNEIESSKRELQEHSARLTRVERDLNTLEDRTTGALETIVNRIENLSGNVDQ